MSTETRRIAAERRQEIETVIEILKRENCPAIGFDDERVPKYLEKLARHYVAAAHGDIAFNKHEVHENSTWLRVICGYEKNSKGSIVRPERFLVEIPDLNQQFISAVGEIFPAVGNNLDPAMEMYF